MINKRLPISKELRDFVLQRDEYTCRYCGSTQGPFHLDHVYPISKGGETTANNLVTACRHCNLSKHNKVGVWPNPLHIKLRDYIKYVVAVVVVWAVSINVYLLISSFVSMSINELILFSVLFVASVGFILLWIVGKVLYNDK